MKKILKVLAGIVVFFLVLHFGLRLTGNGYLSKGFWAAYMHGNNSATIDDARFFETHKIEASATPWQWPVRADYNKAPLSDRLKGILTKTQSVAFLVIQNDSILTEHYWDGYSDSSLSNSFSMAKSITTMLVEIAIQKGVFTGWHQKVNTILPGLKGLHASELELWHLSAMCSGLDWDEAYKNPFTVTAKAYYGDDVSKLMIGLPIIDEPGKNFNYQSGNTELLGMCLIKATGKSLADLASDWLWKPLQAERNAKWHTDDKGTELAYCCFNSDARDFARFGKMMLHSGNWNGTQILDSSFVQLATTGNLVPYYGYSFWLDDSHGTKVFAQRGILGQYIITIPAYNTVVVRLGKHSLPPQNHAPEDFHVIVEEVLKMVKGQA
ncbi:MAG TPA: serine hydrolase [Chitinophagales bacterium]|nr:serine hydrolase [Chitinophagales bacterium]